VCQGRQGRNYSETPVSRVFSQHVLDVCPPVVKEWSGTELSTRAHLSNYPALNTIGLLTPPNLLATSRVTTRFSPTRRDEPGSRGVCRIRISLLPIRSTVA
jgi:hypothetical protein